MADFSDRLYNSLSKINKQQNKCRSDNQRNERIIDIWLISISLPTIDNMLTVHTAIVPAISKQHTVHINEITNSWF